MNHLNASSITVFVYPLLIAISAIISLAICAPWRSCLRRSEDADNEKPPRTEQSSELDIQQSTRAQEISDTESREVGTRRFGERCAHLCPICDRLYSKDAQQLSVDTFAILQDQPILWAPPPPPDPPNPQ